MPKASVVGAAVRAKEVAVEVAAAIRNAEAAERTLIAVSSVASF